MSSSRTTALPSATGRHGGSGELVKLPFNTKDRYSAIEPLGGDVDFFRFRAKAGEILAVETLPGSPMDTMIGLFDEAGNLLALDDDGGVGGIGALSRLLVQVPADGIYAVGVTTWPDFEFTGAGSDFGRYVLNISSYRGTILPVGDDAASKSRLSTFAFPFQGTNWSSVFVNGNGNLTFGAGDPDFTESVAELLAGPPRIAPLWDDLNRSLRARDRGRKGQGAADSLRQRAGVPGHGHELLHGDIGSPRRNHHELRRDQPE